MIQLRFQGKIKPIGNSYMVLIPKSFIKNGILKEEKDYLFLVEEIKKKEVDEGEDKI